MTPYEFLKQQATNVEQALTETLRYDYGPKPTVDYYQECLKRLDLIKIAIATTAETNLPDIATRLGELSYLSVWISLIERSRLGEFSWPFAESLRAMADALLVEPGLSGPFPSPIVHIIADGEGYFIHYENTSPSGKHKFAFINFPRPLKHHVLLHSLFGHELGHTALHTAGIGSAGHILQTYVLSAVQLSGPLSDENSLNSWIHDKAAPPTVTADLNQHQINHGVPFALNHYYYLQWLDEFICDLFGLLLFGPGFAAAHQVYLRPMHSNPYGLAFTHPPYAARHKMLVRAMQIMGWDKPNITRQPYQLAEQDLLNFVLSDPYDRWAMFLSDQQLTQAIDGIKRVFSSHGSLGYAVPDSAALANLVDQLVQHLPPILAGISEEGAPQLRDIDTAHTLYAGWVYQLGASRLTRKPMDFLRVNMLCDHALLQQRAINIAIRKKMK